MSILEKLQDHDWVTAAIQRGARQALIKHKAMGVPIAIWREGKVVLVPPEEIEIPDAPEDCSSSPT
ncbi:MAG: hypothetical protein WC314_22165 [Vulcanimicrobiota bacterium]